MDAASNISSATPRKKTARGPKLREASFKDYEQIALLESRYGLGTLESKSYDKWIHLWQGNPLYRELQPGWSIGWVLEDEGRRIVGSMANIPLPYEFEGKRILAATGRGWVVETEYRAASLVLLDRVINQRGVDLYVNNTVGDHSLAGVSFFNCARVPVGAWDECRFWITNHRSFMEGLLNMKNYPLARPLSYPLSAAVSLKDRLTKKALRAGDVEVKACLAFDGRFDIFWEDLRGKNPHLLLAVRTREALEWHFKHALLDNRVWMVTVPDGPRLAGYAIFVRADHHTLGFKRVRLVDFQSLDGSAALLTPMLCWAARKCRDEGIHMLEILGRYLDEKDLVSTASYRRKLSSWTYFYRANNPELAARLTDQRAWAPSWFDGDASLSV